MSPAVSQRLLMCQPLISGEPGLCSCCLKGEIKGSEGRETIQGLRFLFLTQRAPSWHCWAAPAGIVWHLQQEGQVTSDHGAGKQPPALNSPVQGQVFIPLIP